VTQLGGHYILFSEWAPQKIPHLPPENLDTSFSLFHASREKRTYSPAKARARENKTPRDRQKKRQKLGERLCFCFWDLRRPSAAARRNSSTGAGLRGSTPKSTRHCTPLRFQSLLLLWLISWLVFDSSASKPNTLSLCEITESPLCSYTPTVHEACITLIRWYSWCPWKTAFFSGMWEKFERDVFCTKDRIERWGEKKPSTCKRDSLVTIPGILAELHWGKFQSVNMLPSLDCRDSLSFVKNIPFGIRPLSDHTPK
jgi:hypothetical protein